MRLEVPLPGWNGPSSPYSINLDPPNLSRYQSDSGLLCGNTLTPSHGSSMELTYSTLPLLFLEPMSY